MIKTEESEDGEPYEEGKGEGQHGSVTPGKNHNATAVYPQGEGFCSFRECKRGFHGLHKTRLFCLFMKLGWSSISVTSPTIQSMYRALERIQVGIQCSLPMLFSVTADLTGCSRWFCYWHSFNLILTDLPPLPDVNLATHMKCYISPMS
jgi:hypothetical protein